MLRDIDVKNAKPKDKPYKIHDGQGMYLLVDTKGNKYFRFDYRFNGTRKTLALGAYPKTSLKKARDLLTEARQQIIEGIDPSETRRNQKNIETESRERELCLANGIPVKGSFEEMAHEWLRDKYSKEVVPDTLAKTTRQLELHAFPTLGGLAIKDIKSSDILTMLKPLAGQDKIETAHRIRTLCSSIFNYAIVHNIVDYNPVIALQGALPAIQVTHRAAITEPVKVGQLMRDIYGYQGTFVVMMALRLSALVMVRPGELRQAEWKDFYLEDAEWRYFVTKTKSDHTVPLSKQALSILESIKPLTGNGRYVFPSSRNDGRSMSENTVRTALRSLGYANEDMSAHGFRTVASNPFK